MRNVDSVPWVVAKQGDSQAGKRDDSIDQEDVLHHTHTVQLTQPSWELGNERQPVPSQCIQGCQTLPTLPPPLRSLSDLCGPLLLCIPSARGQEQLPVCSMLLCHMAPVWVITQCPLNEKQNVRIQLVWFPTEDVESRLETGSQVDLRRRLFTVA